jgi:hypothetical protein
LFYREKCLPRSHGTVGKAAMRKALVMLLLTVFSGSAAAAWILVGKTESSMLYAEAFMPQEGDVVKMWNLSDLNASRIFTYGGPTYSSVIRQEEFHCKDERMRTLYLEFNTRNMGRGDAVFSRQTPTGWTPVGPRPVDSSGLRPTDRLYFEIACRKR